MKKTISVLITGLILVSAFMMIWNQPEKRVTRFIDKNSALLEEKIQHDEPLPAAETGKYWNVWTAEHEMVEFILFTWGNTYYGCYYSEDDVPLPFQNGEGIRLNKTADNSWQWHSQGDNKGITRRIKEKWYYFEASF